MFIVTKTKFDSDCVLISIKGSNLLTATMIKNSASK